jgi:hypothetical protein
MGTDGRMDITNLIVAFRNFANAPKKDRKTRNEAGNGIERAMKQKNLTPKDIVNRHILRKQTEYQQPV